MPSIPVRNSPPASNSLLRPLTPEQEALLVAMAAPYVANGTWSVWQHIQEVMDAQGYDADRVIKTLPKAGAQGSSGMSYGLVHGVSPSMHIPEEHRPGLTVAAAVHAPELRPVLSAPFLAMLRRMVKLRRRAITTPEAVTEHWASAEDLDTRREQVWRGVGPQETRRRLLDVLRFEPVGWSGGRREVDGEPHSELTRWVLKFADVNDLESYVSRTVDYVTPHRDGSSEASPSGLTGLAARLSRAQQIPAQPALEPDAPVYVKEALIAELEEFDGAGKFFTDKLVQQLRELNDNFARRNAFSCHSLIRAVMDHVPPAFGQKKFEQAVAQFPWGQTDKKYLGKLREFRDQGDDVMHRQIGPRRNRIDMDDVPAPAALNTLLEGLLGVLRKHRADALVAPSGT